MLKCLGSKSNQKYCAISTMYVVYRNENHFGVACLGKLFEFQRQGMVQIEPNCFTRPTIYVSVRKENSYGVGCLKNEFRWLILENKPFIFFKAHYLLQGPLSM